MVTTSYHIIIADDTEAIRLLLARIAARAYPSARVSGLADGQDALDLFLDQGADLIITDNNMPRLNGLQLIHGVRAHNPHVPILMVSGYPLVELAARQAGATMFLAKPFEVDRLIAVLHALLPPN
ncbi:MAG: response regulator [Roseiflexaceae bacterium]|nr:response regulator [Roseiflexaceae bacterium]